MTSYEFGLHGSRSGRKLCRSLRILEELPLDPMLLIYSIIFSHNFSPFALYPIYHRSATELYRTCDFERKVDEVIASYVARSCGKHLWPKSVFPESLDGFARQRA